MQRLFQDFEKELTNFIEQRERAAFILSSVGEESVYAIKTLKNIEESGSNDLFLLFPHEFSVAPKYASLIVERIKASYEVARQEIGSGIGPDLPALCFDEKRPAWLRIREALISVRSLFPADSDRRVIFGMLPLTIKDMVGYGKLAAMLLSTEEIPWFSRIRIILRDNANEPMIESGIYKSDFVLVKQVDFSPKAMEAAITAELKNNGIGLEQRAQLMVQLASMDYSHQRYNEAISKYKELLAYFQQTTNLPFQSLVMNGLGDVYRRANKPRLAIEWYERALVPAADSKSPVILFSIARNLAHTHFEQGEFDRAEIYFDGAQQLGPVTNDPEARMLSLEWRGLCQQEQAILEKAFESFKLATLEAREFKRDEHFQRNLSHMQRSIEMMDDSSLRTQCLRELLVLEKESDMGNSAPMRELHTS